jgi:hypothetical protein
VNKMGAHSYPRWRAYLYCSVGGIAKIHYWDWVPYNTKRLAMNAARKCANDVYKKYKKLGAQKPIEENKSNGAVIFRIPGMREERWPRVEPIE